MSEPLTREIRILVMISHGPSRDSNNQFFLVGRQIVLVEPRRILGYNSIIHTNTIGVLTHYYYFFQIVCRAR